MCGSLARGASLSPRGERRRKTLEGEHPTRLRKTSSPAYTSRTSVGENDRPSAGEEPPPMEIHESIQEIFRNDRRVADRFYGLFLERHPEARPYFEGIDLGRQAVLLTMALMLVEHHYVHRNRVSEDYLRVLGYQHHVRRGIPAELYLPFCDCLL